MKPSQSERFTQAVMREFSDSAGKVSVTPLQRKLIQNYFIKIDMILKDNEQKRLAKSDKYRDPLAFEWNNVNMKQLALDVVAFSAVGLDPIQKNQVHPIPYKNNKTNQFDIGFIIGYDGAELKAKKYGYEVPDNVIVELVRENDRFKPIKKDKDNPVETYQFDIGDGFNRGAIIGGFYYHDYKETPEKNKLRILSLADIEKRKPKYASPEFWGGKKDKWENGKKVGSEEVEGWYDEMCWKTVKRAAYNAIPIDSEKIDEHLVRVLQAPEDYANNQTEDIVHTEIRQNANRKQITMDEDPPQDVVQDPAPINPEQEPSENPI